MPETMSLERQKLLKAYGAKIVLTAGEKGMQGSVDKANELANKIENSYIPGQFVNPSNPLAHEETTALEIIDDLMIILTILLPELVLEGQLQELLGY